MDEKEILQNLAKTILNEGSTYKIVIKPETRLQRILQARGLMPKEKVFTLTDTTMGNMIRVSGLLLEIDSEIFRNREDLVSSFYKAIRDHGPALSEAVATLLVNRRRKPTTAEIKLIRENMSGAEMQRLMSKVFTAMNMQAFMNTITLIRGLSILEKKDASVPVAV